MLGIEAGDVVQDRTPPGYGPTGNAGLRVLMVLDVPPVGGYLGDRVVAAQHRLPQGLGGVDTPG